MTRLLVFVLVGVLCSARLSHGNPPVDFSRGAFGILNAGDQAGISELPEAYFDYLSRLNMQWVAIGLTLHVANSVDSTVERLYSSDYATYVPTYPDSTIRRMIQQLRARGYKVLVSLSLDEPWNEDGTPNATVPGKAAWRYQIGDPITPTGYTLAEWPWNPANANHAAFVSSFWASYTREAVHFADICEQESVDVYQLGAETQELFRTRPIGARTNHFRTQIQALVDSTRAHYSGLVGYYMHSGTWALAWHNADTLYHELWGDANFDIIGGSIYGLLNPRTTIAGNTLAYLKGRFTTIFTTYFRPVVNKYPGKTVAILELGIPAWDRTAPNAEPDGASLMTREDLNNNRLIDAEEVQSNAFDAYYSVADSLGYPEPGFLFGDGASTDAMAHLGSAYWGWGVRNRLAELTLMRRFRNITITSGQNTPPRLLTLSDSNYVTIIGQELATRPFLAVDDDTVNGDVVLTRTEWLNYPWFGPAPSRGKAVGIPQDDDAGWWQAKLYAQDVFGRPSVDTARFILWAIHPRSPEVSSIPPTTMTPGQAVTYQTRVLDGSGNVITTGLTYSLTVNPFFLSVNTSGRVTGMPTFAVAGTTRAAEVRIIKTTVPRDTFYDSWEIWVADVNDPPTWGGDGSIISPANQAVVRADSIPFRVGYANDLNDDTLSFIFHIFGQGLDTTFIRKSGVISRSGAQRWDTTQIRFPLNLSGRVTPGQTYTWNVRVTDNRDTLISGTSAFQIQNGPTPLLNSGLPKQYALGRGVLSPDGRTIRISIALPRSGRVSLQAYDAYGKKVGVLANGYFEAGYYDLSADASKCSGNVLLYKMRAGHFSAVKKMTLIR